jgi:CelD/BcsL family acetyltransferase involved in cellulose biosynthesis
MFYQSGFIEVDDNRLKPGLSTHAACMQECMNRGFLAYNFLAGEARYKRELANSERMLKSAVSYRFQGTPKVLDGIDRLGLIEKARSIKRRRERSTVSRMRPDNNKPSQVVQS